VGKDLRAMFLALERVLGGDFRHPKSSWMGVLVAGIIIWYLVNGYSARIV
jgi:hypothetical protein